MTDQQKQGDALNQSAALVEEVVRLHKGGAKELPDKLKNQVNVAMGNSEFRAAILALVVAEVVQGRESLGLLMLFLGSKGNKYVYLARAWKILAGLINYKPRFDRGAAAFTVKKSKELLADLEAKLTQTQEKQKANETAWLEGKQLAATIDDLTRQINALKGNIPVVEDWQWKRGAFDPDPAKRPVYNKPKDQPKPEQTEQQRAQDKHAAKVVADLNVVVPIQAPTEPTTLQQLQDLIEQRIEQGLSGLVQYIQGLGDRITRLQQEAEQLRQSGDRKGALAKDSEAIQLEDELANAQIRLHAADASRQEQTPVTVVASPELLELPVFTNDAVLEQPEVFSGIVEAAPELPATLTTFEAPVEDLDVPMPTINMLEFVEIPVPDRFEDPAEPEATAMPQQVQEDPAPVVVQNALTDEVAERFLFTARVESAGFNNALKKALLDRLAKDGLQAANERLENILKMRAQSQ